MICAKKSVFLHSLNQMRRLSAILLFLLIQALHAQVFTVVPNGNGGGLAVDLHYLWRYNLYEHSRWGLGMAYDSDSAQRWHVVANVGYGLRDKQLKWGLGASRLMDSEHGGRFYIIACREYSAAGNRRMQATDITDPGCLASFMSLRMSDQTSVTGGYRWSTPLLAGIVDLRLFCGGRLFNNDGPLYRKDGDTIAPENGIELRLHCAAGGFAAEAVIGTTWPAHKPVAQLLVEYSRTFHLSPFTFHLHAQTGITPPNTPYIYMFDLGGTLGSPLFFRNSLLTIHPCEYTANLFASASSLLRLSSPLFSVYNRVLALGMAPRPFLGIDAEWGMMWGQDGDGRIHYEGLDLQAPCHGVAEAVVGVDGLLRWGVVDYGCAVACGFIPHATSLRWTILLSAELSL